LIFESSPEGTQTPAVMASADFKWTTVEEIRPALLRNSLGTVSKMKATDHLHELERVGVELCASVLVCENAARLATGYDDLVVVLLEPSDRAEWVEYDGMKASSKALQLTDETLSAVGLWLSALFQSNEIG
jgi:hypothetical protein